jgi:DNA-binding transcriptional MerR regulator
MPKARREYLKTQEVAEALDVSLTTVYNWLRSGRIPEPERNPLSNHRLWKVKDVELIRSLLGSER